MRQPIRASAKRKLATRDAATRSGSVAKRSSRRQRVARKAVFKSTASQAPERKAVRKPGAALEKAPAANKSVKKAAKPAQTAAKKAGAVARASAAVLGNAAETATEVVGTGKPVRRERGRAATMAEATRAAATKAETAGAETASPAHQAMDVPQVRASARSAVRESAKDHKDDRVRSEETARIGAIYGSVIPGFAELNLRAFEVAQESVCAALKLAHDVLRARSFGEVFGIQAAYARDRFEAQVAHARQIAALSSKFVTGAVRCAG